MRLPVLVLLALATATRAVPPDVTQNAVVAQVTKRADPVETRADFIGWFMFSNGTCKFRTPFTQRWKILD